MVEGQPVEQREPLDEPRDAVSRERPTMLGGPKLTVSRAQRAGEQQTRPEVRPVRG